MASATTQAPATGLPDLKVSTTDQPPFVMREPTVGGEVYSGFVVDLLKEVSRRAGFTYSLQQSTGGGVGAPRAGGWTGIIGDVESGVATIGAGAITITPEREDVVDFTKPFMSNSVNLLVQKPTWSSLGLGYLVRPFSGDYWIMVLVCLLLVGIVFFLIGKFSPYEWGNVAADRDPRGAKNSFTFRNSYLFALSTISWQGFREAPKSLSGRIMAAFWFLFVLFTLIAYTGNLTAYLLARPEQIPNMPFKTYEDLLESNDITVSALNFGTTQNKLRTSRATTMKSLWSKINSQGSWVGDYDEGLERVKSAKDSNFVMFMESRSAEYFARKNCELMIYGENLFPSSMAFAVKKGSVWRNKISDAIKDMHQDGFMEQLVDKYWRFNGKCENVDGRKYLSTDNFLSSLPIYPITLKDMAVAILLFFLGMIVAFVFLIIEIVHYAVTKKGKKIEKPAILKNPPKIFKGRGKKPAKPSPADPEAGPSTSGDALESVPLEDAEEPAASSGDELRPEGEEEPKV